MTETCIPITTHEHFCELADEFDNKFKTTTLIGFDNLTSIWKRFPLTVKTGPDIVDYVHFRIVQNIKIGFIDKSRTSTPTKRYASSKSKYTAAGLNSSLKYPTRTNNN